MSVQAPITTPTESAPSTPPRGCRELFVDHLQVWLKNCDHQGEACTEQYIINHVKKLNRQKAVRLAQEENLYADRFLDSAKLETFKNELEQEAEEVFQSSQDSINLKHNIYSSSPLSALPPLSSKKKTLKSLLK